MPNIIGKIGVKKRQYTGRIIGKVVECQKHYSGDNSRKTFKIIIEYIVGNNPYRYVLDRVPYRIALFTEVEMLYDESEPVYSEVFKVHSNNFILNKIYDIYINIPGGKLFVFVAELVLISFIVWLILFLCYNLSS